MKKFLVFLSIVASIVTSCSDAPISEQEMVVRMLTSGNWIVRQAAIEGEDVSSTFSSFTIRFSTSDYETHNAHGCWQHSGSWQFEEGSSYALLRDDGVVIEIASLTETQLILNGKWDSIVDDTGVVQRGHSHRFEFVKLKD